MEEDHDYENRSPSRLPMLRWMGSAWWGNLVLVAYLDSEFRGTSESAPRQNTSGSLHDTVTRPAANAYNRLS